MFTKIKKLYHNLAARLCILICVLVMPVNILAVALTQVISHQYQIEMTERYQSELNMFCTQVNKELEIITEELAKLVVGDFRAVFGVDIGTDAAWQTNLFFQELAAIRTAHDLIDVAYMVHHESGKGLITCDMTQYSIEEKDVIYAALKDCDFGAGYGYTYRVENLGGFPFLVLNVNFRNSSFGVLMNLYDFFNVLRTSESQESAEFLLADMENNVHFSTEDGCVFQTFDEAPRIMSQPLAGSFYLTRTIADESIMTTMPVLYKALQVLAICSIFVIPLIFIFINREVIRPLKRTENALRQIENDNLEYRIQERASTGEFQYVYDSFNDMAGDIKALTIESYEKEIERLKLESTSILLQVSPHMLLNSLNMIYSLSQSRDFDSIQKFAVNLSAYFRYVLRKDQQFVTVEEEMRFISNYLEIQRIRYPDTFTSVYQMDEDVKHIRIPTFFIENFVENSIKYALSPEKITEIIIIIRKENDRLFISILDTGNGIPEDRLKLLNEGAAVEDKTGKHIGILNCRKRMQMYYGEDAVMRITSKIGEGTQVWMELPYKKLEM